MSVDRVCESGGGLRGRSRFSFRDCSLRSAVRRLPSVVCHWCACALLAVACADAVPVASDTPISLGDPSGTFAEPFTRITSLRELADGRMIVTDFVERRIMVGRFDGSPAAPVGRRGPGPREWSSARPIRALRGDTSLLVDAVARRWIRFVDTLVVGQISPDALVRRSIGSADDADTLGNVYARQPLGDDPRDSILVLRAAIGDGKVDTLAIIRSQTSLGPRGTDEEGNRLPVARPAFATGEEFVAFADGWVAIARLDPLRVDWIAPDGRRIDGTPVGEPPLPVTEAEKERVRAENASVIEFFGRATGAIREVMLAPYTVFPDELPPFEPSALIAGGDGLAYLRRLEPAGMRGARYDVFDRAGRRVGIMRLDTHSELGLVSSRFRYVIRTDADSLQWVDRYAIPRP